MKKNAATISEGAIENAALKYDLRYTTTQREHAPVTVLCKQTYYYGSKQKENVVRICSTTNTLENSNDICEIEDFVETHLCNLRGIVQSRGLRVLRGTKYDKSDNSLRNLVAVEVRGVNIYGILHGGVADIQPMPNAWVRAALFMGMRLVWLVHAP